jgi:hypothetical protein
MPTLHDPAFRASLVARLNALDPSSPRKWGAMSADQMLWHVNQFLAAALGEGTLPAHKPPLPAPLMRLMVLYMPWPKSAPTNPGAVAGETHDFEAEKARCRTLIERFAAKPMEGAWPADPSFGQSTGTFASKLQAKHLDHHFRQFGA